MLKIRVRNKWARRLVARDQDVICARAAVVEPMRSAPAVIVKYRPVKLQESVLIAP